MAHSMDWLSQGQRRLAAIMFTDMVGYTALGQKNETLSLALVEEQRKVIRPILARHSGREVKTIGDAFLVEFPNAVEAIRCAYDIQRAVRDFNLSLESDKRIHLRIGVHVGEVVESQGDISGDTVNVASRIEPLSEDGGVCVTRTVYDFVKGKVDIPLTSLGPKSLKNVTEPMEIFKMVMPWEGEGGSSPMQLDTRRVAVLPFANMSPDPADVYFADGMTEELIASLSGVNGLSVIARTSVMKYKDGSKGALEVARELNVGTLVEGSVRKAGDRLRITVQMIDGRTESHSWARNYDKRLDDIFAIQSDVAKQVADALQVQLLSAERKKLETAPTSNIEAYTLYLKGIYHLNRAYGEAKPLRTAILHFEEAIANDPKFAGAYAQLAYTYDTLGWFGMMPPKTASEKAKAYVEKALALDDSLADAHQVMGRVCRNFLWDFTRAEREFSRAIELSPSHADAMGNRAMLKSFNRQFDEAAKEIRRAVDLDPVSGRGAGYAGTVYLYGGMFDEAIQQFTRYLEADQGSVYALGNIGLAHIQKGMVEQGLREVIAATPHGQGASMSDLAYAYAKAGKVEELRNLLTELLNEVVGNDGLATSVACVYAQLGEADEAMKWLEKAYEERVGYLVAANSDFAFDAIRADPRFQALMKKIGWTNTL